MFIEYLLCILDIYSTCMLNIYNIIHDLHTYCKFRKYFNLIDYNEE